MKEQITRLLGQKDYVPANVPELLQLLRLPPSRQQVLQGALRELEQAGLIARLKGNRYIQPSAADLIPGRIRMNRQGKGFLQPDDAGLKEIAIPESATGTAMHEDRVLVRRDVRSRGLRSGAADQGTGEVVRIEGCRCGIVFTGQFNTEVTKTRKVLNEAAPVEKASLAKSLKSKFTSSKSIS